MSRVEPIIGSAGSPNLNGHPHRFYHLTDIGNGERFVDQHGDRVRYVPEWRSWLVWDGQRWRRDRGDVEVMALAKQTAVSIYDDLDQAKIDLQHAAQAGDEAQRKTLDGVVKALLRHAPRSSTSPRLRAMVDLAVSEPGMVVTPDMLDQDVHVLNTPSGLVDLTTGALRTHDPAALCTRMTSAPYDADAPAEFWLAMLEAIFRGDAELIRYFQRMLGLAVTGNPGERRLPLCHGPAGTGKTSTFFGLSRALGDYATTADAAGILLGKDDGRPNEHVADLAGRRVVVLPELPKGRLNTSRVKRLTGGDRIATHRKFEHVFEFAPTHTFFAYTNDKPEVAETGAAIWTRIRLIPFEHQFDQQLSKADVERRLTSEAAGILAWIVQGAVDYLRDGLGAEPECVRIATSDYQAEEDVIGLFLEERAVHQAGAWTASAELYKAYRAWCDDQGIRPESAPEFGRQLASHGLEPKKGPKGRRGFSGVRVEGTLV